MDKKFLGIKLSTYLTVLVCLIAAFLLWLCVNVSASVSREAACMLCNLRCLL